MKLSRIQIRKIVESVINEDESKSSSGIASTKSEVESQFKAAISSLNNNESDVSVIVQFEQALASFSGKIYDTHLKAIFNAEGARAQQNAAKTIEAAVKKFTNVAMKAPKENVQKRLLDNLKSALDVAEGQAEFNKSAFAKMTRDKGIS